MKKHLEEEYNKGYEAGYRDAEIDRKMYGEKYRLKTAIIDAISESRTINSCRAEKIFQKWLIEEDGEIALDQLANLIVWEEI